MKAGPRQDPVTPARERAPSEEAAIRAVASWVNQLARTLKTCRLYDSNNPTVVRFREELAGALQRLLDERGTMVLRFTADDVFCDEVSLYPAKSRDDNLALPFYQDGIHALTLSKGIEELEVEALLDAILQVTGQNLGQDDLVTLLWEAHLDHVDVEYVPSEGDLGSGGEEGVDRGEVVPWPTAQDDAESGTMPVNEDGTPDGGRSDDWSVTGQTAEIEAELSELETIAPTEMQRFLDEHQGERNAPMLHSVLGVVRAGLEAQARDDDREDFGRFLPKVLRQTISAGDWRDAHEAVALLSHCPSREWSPEIFMQELLQPISIAGVVEKLDAQDPARIGEYVELARALGDPALDWINLALAESQQRRTRRALAEAIAHICRDNPERLAPWLSDPRWYVVRNVVHILGWIGGDSIVGLLQAAVRHSDPRVRQEVIAALGQVEPRLSRPVLLSMLESSDTKQFCSVLHQLSLGKDPEVARTVMKMLQAEAFDARPVEEKRSIYSAVSATGGDEILPELEAELNKGGWFQRGSDLHRAAVARCIARLGTPAAREVLEVGARSKRGPLKKACDDALAGWSDRT